MTGDGTGAAGAQGGNASGGTIQNITGAHAIITAERDGYFVDTTAIYRSMLNRQESDF